jgi:hypothetical protein
MMYLGSRESPEAGLPQEANRLILFNVETVHFLLA